MREEELHELMPLARTLGIRLLAAGSAEVRCRLDWAPALCTADGALHGGVLMALGDSAGALCAHLSLPAGASTTTIESSTSFLRAVREGHVEAVARPLHVGRTVIVVETDLLDAGGRRVARVRQSQLVLARD